MAEFIVTYMGGDKPQTEEEGKKHFAEYQQWLGSLGEAVVKPMVPFKNIHVVAPDGTATEGSSAGISGQTVLQADSIEAALAMLKGCPFLKINGTLEIAEVVNMG